MAEYPIWRMNPGEELVLGVSLASDLHASALLTGDPTVTVYQYDAISGEWDDVTTDFGIENAARNASVITDRLGNSVAIDTGVVFEMTTPLDGAGEYTVLVECGADDGTRPSTDELLVVAGPPQVGS